MKNWRLSAPRAGSGEGGFTLLEALIAVALMSMLLAMLATVTGQWMRSWRAGFPRVQSADQLGLGLDRIAADLAAAEFVSLGGENAPPYFNGTPSSVTFVRSAIGPYASAGQLEIIRLSETDDDARGRVLVRELASFEPVTAEALDAGELEFTKRVVLMRPPFRVSFAFWGRDRVWQDTWHDDKQLPIAVGVTVRNALTDEIFSTATLLKVNAPAACVQSGATACGGQNDGAGTTQPGTTQPGPGPL